MQKLRLRSFFYSGILLLSTSIPSTAQFQPLLIFNAPPTPVNGNGYDTTFEIMADDFSFPQNVTLQKVSFWTTDQNNLSGWDGSLKYYIFSDVNGKPSSVPLYQANVFNISVKNTGKKVLQTFTENQFSFTFPTPVKLKGNTKYWLGIHLNNTYVLKNIFWETTDQAFGIPSYAAYQGNLNNWMLNYNNSNLAFKINAIPLNERVVLRRKSASSSQRFLVFSTK
ncbi:hypothetical protein [Nostoc sp.]|uniref:hypothetical protein n=1 Tax=Nostoc sp. TaxID=1180 RepID=UPI002FF5F7EC